MGGPGGYSSSVNWLNQEIWDKECILISNENKSPTGTMVSDGPDIFGPKADDFIFSLSIYIKLVITKKRIKTSTDR